MELTKEYLKIQKDCIERNFAGYKRNIHDPVTIHRLNTLKSFINCYANLLVHPHIKILSVGSGGFEPVFIGSNFACDVDEISYNLLRSQGWKGFFFPCSCDHIPYPNSYFSVAVCSEVIEHLPSDDIVSATIKELNRVADHWIITTPIRDVQEPTHRKVFNAFELKQLAGDIPCTLETKGLFFYLHNGERKIFD